MKKTRIAISFLVWGAIAGLVPACTDRVSGPGDCNAITLNKPFTGKIGETWCIPATGWEITFGPFLEDSRCNVEGLICVWEGRFVMDAAIDNGEPYVVTFDPHMSSQDTVLSGLYTIIIQRVFPETRTSFDGPEPEDYSFEVLVK